MRYLLIAAIVLCGCASQPRPQIDERELIGIFANGDQISPRSIELKGDSTFTYTQMTDVINTKGEFVGSWGLEGKWTFKAPDKIELKPRSGGKSVFLFARPSNRSGLAILEPDLFPEVLSTWSDDGGMRYLKKVAKKAPKPEQFKLSYSETEQIFSYGKHELEYSYEPTFRPGFVIRILVLTNQILVVSNRLDWMNDEHSSYHAFGAKIAESVISAEKLRRIEEILESTQMRSQSEESSIGPDGILLTFRKDKGYRRVVLKIWMPDNSSPAAKLAALFGDAAGLPYQPIHDEWPNKALEPTTTAVTAPAAQEPRQP